MSGALWSLLTCLATDEKAYSQGLGKRGVDVTYVGGSSSVLAVGGFSQGGGNLAVWDTLAAPSGGPIGSLGHHSSMVTSIQVTPKSTSDPASPKLGACTFLVCYTCVLVLDRLCAQRFFSMPPPYSWQTLDHILELELEG